MKQLAASLFFFIGLSSPLVAKEYDYLFVDAFVNGSSLDTTYDAISADFKTLYIPAEQLFSSLDFSLEVDALAGKIAGWYIREENSFYLDKTNGIVRRKVAVQPEDANQLEIQEYQFNIEPGQIIFYDDTLYISDKALKLWLGIDSQIRFGRLMINLKPDLELPQQARLKRQKKHQLLSHRRLKEKSYKFVDDQYQWFTVPGIDVRFGFARLRDKEGRQKSAQSMFIKSSLDLAQHGIQYNYNHSSSDSNARLTIAKQLDFLDDNWVYQFGDIRPIGSALVPSGSLGVGFSLNAAALDQLSNFTRRIEGLGHPGWEAELYRNETVIDYQVIGNTGFYLFENVPLRLGENNIRVVLYGPQGEKEVTEYTYFTYKHDLKQGHWQPEFSLLQPKRSVFFSDANDYVDARFRLNYGLTDTIAASIGYFYNQEDQQARYLNHSLYGFLGNNGFSATHRYDLEHQLNSWQVNWQTKLLNQDFTFSTQRLNVFVDQSIEQSNLATLSMSGDVMWGKEVASYSLNIDNQDGDWQGGALFSARVNQFDFGHTLTYWDGEDRRLEGDLLVGLPIYGASLRASAKYSIQPIRQLEQVYVTLSGSWFKYNWQLQYSDDRALNSYYWSAGISKTFKQFSLNTKLEKTDQETQISLNVSTSFDFNNFGLSSQSVANSASIKALAYLDKNNNRRFDSFDQPIKNIAFNGKSYWRDISTNEQGIAILNRASANTVQKISVNPESVEDPFWRLNSGSYKISTHPGAQVELEFAFVQTVEVEGEVHLWSESNKEFLPKGGIPIAITKLSGEVVKETRTEFDGFFLFDDIEPGEYLLAVNEVYLKAKNLPLLEPQRLSLYPEDSDDVTFYADLILLGNDSRPIIGTETQSEIDQIVL